MTANSQFDTKGPWVTFAGPDQFVWVDPWAALQRERASSQYIGWAMTNAVNDPIYMQSVNAAQRQYQAPVTSYGYNEQAPHVPIVEIRHEVSDSPAPSTAGLLLIALIFIPLFVVVVMGAVG